MGKKIYIYSLSHPNRKNVVRYVGKATNPNARLWGHVNLLKTSKKDAWIWSLLNKGKKPLMTILEVCNEKDWHLREAYYIKKYRYKFKSKLLNSRRPVKNRIKNTDWVRRKEIKNLLINAKYYIVKEYGNHLDGRSYVCNFKNDIFIEVRGGVRTQGLHYYIWYRNDKYTVPKSCCIYSPNNSSIPYITEVKTLSARNKKRFLTNNED